MLENHSLQYLVCDVCAPAVTQKFPHSFNVRCLTKSLEFKFCFNFIIVIIIIISMHMSYPKLTIIIPIMLTWSSFSVILPEVTVICLVNYLTLITEFSNFKKTLIYCMTDHFRSGFIFHIFCDMLRPQIQQFVKNTEIVNLKFINM